MDWILISGVLVFLVTTAIFWTRLSYSKLKHQQEIQEKTQAIEERDRKQLEVVQLREELKSSQVQNSDLVQRLAVSDTRILEYDRRLGEQKQLLDDAEKKFSAVFKGLATEVLSQSSEAFLKLAAERLDKKTVEAKGAFDEKISIFQRLIEPIRESLGKVETDLSKVEKERAEQYGKIAAQMAAVTQSSESLKKEAMSLSTALRRPEVRGSWGEIQLRRVVELAGMSSYCDFEEQVTAQKDDKLQKPDMIVRLPNGRQIIVDSKAVLDAFLDAESAATEAEKKDLYLRHARNLRSRVSDLSRKSYWEQFKDSPEFAVLFIPNEALLAAAVEVDRAIIEDALSERIVIATPTTLVALLKAVAYGWQQEKVTENAQKVIAAAKELHERVAPWLKHMEDLGKRLDGAVGSYNSAVSSLERRVLPAAKRLKELGVPGAEELRDLNEVHERVRELKSPEIG